MNRRQWLTRSTAAGAAGLPWLLPDQARAAQPEAGKLAPLKITDVKTDPHRPGRHPAGRRQGA